ncbi:hypothetical protein GCM10027290_33200 [Micromonospora sonneratiae]|uniref:Helix-turn-helix domain-containing protein n=1 Tax=Micromonospora sonneratiae TaxID=1184706 RepID=A0ABW3Y9M1_9ACTN
MRTTERGWFAMGRPERRIDPQAGPVQAFAAELRALRESAGMPKYATLAHRTGKSKTVLTEAAGGRRLPTWETVAAYVEGCEGDPLHWRQRWENVSRLVAPDLVEAEQPDTAADLAEAEQPDTAADLAEADQPNRAADLAEADQPNRAADLAEADQPNRAADLAGGAATVTGTATTTSSANPGRRPFWLLAGGLAGLLAIVLGAAAVADGPGPEPQPEADTGLVVADEADPKDSGCAAFPDVLSLDHVEMVHDQRPIGALELRYSPRCGAAWPRFTPYGNSPVPAETVVHVDVVRPADGRRANFAMPYAGTSVFGNVLRSTESCVLAEARVVRAQAAEPQVVASARTACYRGRTRESDSGSASTGP